MTNELLAAYAAQQGVLSQEAVTHTQSSRSLNEEQNELEACFARLTVCSNTSQPGQPYIYENLDKPESQIRLMLLAPARDAQDEICCALHVVTLSEARNQGFTAISYACGDQTKRRDIFIGGRKLSVTYNLHEAFVNLRHTEQYQYFWADAVCIHQTNLREKSLQILVMQDIYSLAAQVVIWLGLSDQELDALFHRLIQIDAHNMAKQTKTFYDMFQYSHESDSIYSAFIKLWTKPWFNRVWCTQEYCVASGVPIVACGEHRVPWNVINTALTAIDMIWPQKKSTIQRQLQGASTNVHAGAMYITYKFHKSLDLGCALHYTSAKLATEPRDKVYAVLGLVSPSIRQSLAPDYSQSLSAVYQKAMVAACKEHMVLTPLWAAADTKTDPKLQLPSWCLDFSDTHWQEAFAELHDFPLLWTSHVSGACGHYPTAIPAHIEHNPLTSQITVYGTVVGTIQEALVMSFTSNLREQTRLETSGPVNSSILSELKSNIVRKFLDDIGIASHMAHEYSSFQPGTSSAEAWKQTAHKVWSVFDRGNGTDQFLKAIWKGSGLNPPQNFTDFESFRQRSNGKPTVSNWDVELAAEERTRTPKSRLVNDCIVKSCLALAHAIPDRTFVVTDTGYIGRASKDARPRDLLCIIFGCARPLILRPSGVDKSGENLYELVASACVNGIMGGQFLRKSDLSRYRFTLR